MSVDTNILYIEYAITLHTQSCLAYFFGGSIDDLEELAKRHNSGTIQFFLVVESIVFTKTSDFFDALWGLIALYFTFNIQHPKALTNVLVFTQHLLLGIKNNSHKIPPLLTECTYSAMVKTVSD